MLRERGEAKSSVLRVWGLGQGVLVDAEGARQGKELGK
jgi:hypothetical protein